MDLYKYEIIFEGIVQGVGFRYFVKNICNFYGVSGYVRNEEDGTVFALIEADETIFPELIEKIKKGNGYSNIFNMEIKKEKILKRSYNSFFIDF